jgi:chaperonin GroEL
MAGSATLWVGGSTELEIEARKEAAKRTIEALRGAILEGVIPGGGVSLLACQPVLQCQLEYTIGGDERAAYHILLKALEAPIRTLLSNAGYDASEVMAQVRQADPGYGFDVVQGAIVDMAQAGIYDVATVQKAALHGAVSSAALALTVDVLVHHKQPRQQVSP